MTGIKRVLTSALAVFLAGLLAGAAAQSHTPSDAPADAGYSSENTALLIIDPYNDFMTEGGKLYAPTLQTASAVGFYENMRQLVPAIRAVGIPVFIVPHHKAKPGDFENWYAVTSSQKAAERIQLFAEGSWGAEWNAEFGPQAVDVIVKEHWAQSGFANTDLDQQLKQRGIRRVVIVGFLANTCVESTGRFAMELGYHVTLVKDATAALSQDAMRAAHEVNGPTFAHAIVKSVELMDALTQPR